MDEKRVLLKHFLAALAYRTQKALRDAPPEFADFRAAPLVRTPHELVSHMDSVLGYSRTFFLGGTYRPPTLLDFPAVIEHFHEVSPTWPVTSNLAPSFTASPRRPFCKAPSPTP